MYIFLIFFSASLAAIVAMIGYRLWELKSGRAQEGDESEPLLPLDEIISRLPVVEQEVVALYNRGYRYARRAASQLGTLAKNSQVTARFQRTINSMNGKNGIVKRESKSQFFKTIAEHKEKIKDQQS